MKIKLISAAKPPDHYSIDGDMITAHIGDISEEFDLSELEYDSELEKSGEFRGVDPEELNLNSRDIIRDAYRDEDGELHVTLCQRVIASQLKGRRADWRGDQGEIDSDDYDPDKCYITPTGVSDLTEGEDYEIVWAKGRAKGEEGWTIRPVEDE